MGVDRSVQFTLTQLSVKDLARQKSCTHNESLWFREARLSTRSMGLQWTALFKDWAATASKFGHFIFPQHLL